MGKLNILHHKDWHVYSKTNRDKVLKDEKKAAEIERANEEKQHKIEQERRLELLRSKLPKDARVSKKEAPVRLFAEEEKLRHTELLMTDKERDQKAKEDRHTWFLGETRDGKKDHPWYNKLDYGHSEKAKSLNLAKLEQQKSREDPMAIVPKSKSTASAPSLKAGTSNSIEEMRRRRLEREAAERERMLLVLDPTYKSRHESDRHYYNSQFNSQNVRKRQ